jgi:hypothetical protein
VVVGCESLGATKVNAWISQPAAPNGSDISGWVFLGQAPCTDGQASFSKTGLLPSTVTLFLNLLQDDGTFIGLSNLSFALFDGPEPAHLNFNVKAPVFVPVNLTWQITSPQGFLQVAQSCADVGADTVRVLAGSVFANGKPRVIGTLPCQDALGNQGGTLQLPQGLSVGVEAQLEGNGLRLGAIDQGFAIGSGTTLALTFSNIGGYLDPNNPTGDGNLDVSWTVDDQPAAAGCPLGSTVKLSNPSRTLGIFDCTAGVAHLGDLPVQFNTLNGAFGSDAPGPPITNLWVGATKTKTPQVIAGQTVNAGVMRFFTKTATTGFLDLHWTVDGALPNTTNCFGTSTPLRFIFGGDPLVNLNCTLGHATLPGFSPGTGTLQGILGSGADTHTGSATVTVAATQTTGVNINLVP